MSVQYLAVASNSALLLLYCLATTASCGSSVMRLGLGLGLGLWLWLGLGLWSGLGLGLALETYATGGRYK